MASPWRSMGLSRRPYLEAAWTSRASSSCQPPPNGARQLTRHGAFQSALVAFWHRPWVPQLWSAACSTQLSARSVGGEGET